MTKQLSILIGGLGLTTIQNYQPIQLESFSEAGIDLLYLDTHANQYHLIPDQIQKISANLYGAGGDISIGMEKFHTIKEQIINLIQPYQMITITAGFGGGTGSGFTIEIIKICKELGKLCLVIGNTLKQEEYFSDRASTQQALVTEVLDVSCPYILIASRKIETYLASTGGLAREYEAYFSNLSFNLIMSINLAIQAGIDQEDLKSNLGVGLIHFAISTEGDAKNVFKELTEGRFSEGKTRNMIKYNLLYPSNINQSVKSELLSQFDNSFEIQDAKRQTINGSFYILFANLHTPNIQASIQQHTPSIHLAYNSLIQKNNFSNLNIQTSIQQHTPSIQSSIQLHTTNPQEFLNSIWEGENLENVSYGEALKFINHNLSDLESKYKINLKKEITKSTIQHFKKSRSN